MLVSAKHQHESCSNFVGSQVSKFGSLTTIILGAMFLFLWPFLLPMNQFSCSVMCDSATPWTTAWQASLSITNSRSPSKLMSIESVMPSSHLILCRPLPPIFPSIKVFSNELTLRMRWPQYWSFSFSISL